VKCGKQQEITPENGSEKEETPTSNCEEAPTNRKSTKDQTNWLLPKLTKINKKYKDMPIFGGYDNKKARATS